jgi:hypothetical protein
MYTGGGRGLIWIQFSILLRSIRNQMRLYLIELPVGKKFFDQEDKTSEYLHIFGHICLQNRLQRL